MAKCGIFALIWEATFDRRHLHLFDRAKLLGFDGLEMPLVREILEGLPKKEMKRKSEETGVACVFCAGLAEDTNVASPDVTTRIEGVKYLKRCVDTVVEMDGDILAGILYAPWGYMTGRPRTTDETKWSQEALREVCEYAAPRGILLAIEPVSRFESYFLATAEEALEFCQGVDHPNIGLHLDTFQMNIEEKSLGGAIRLAGDKLYHFHLCASDRGVPGTGHIDWAEVFSSLKEIGYDRWITIESFTPEPGASGAKAGIWRKLAPSGDAIAQGGLALFNQYMR